MNNSSKEVRKTCTTVSAFTPASANSELHRILKKIC